MAQLFGCWHIDLSYCEFRQRGDVQGNLKGWAAAAEAASRVAPACRLWLLNVDAEYSSGDAGAAVVQQAKAFGSRAGSRLEVFDDLRLLYRKPDLSAVGAHPDFA